MDEYVGRQKAVKRRSRSEPPPPPPPDPNRPISPLVLEAIRINMARPRVANPATIENELAKCAADPVYFVNSYAQIFDNETRGWIPFKLWDFQASALQDVVAWDFDDDMPVNLRIVSLKTRQIGFTWLFGVAHKLWKMRFQPHGICEVLVFSQSDEEAMAIISEQRLKGMYDHLPEWMKIPVTVSSAHEFRFGNGSGIRALPESRGGDSRTVTDVFIDEADLINDLDELLSRAEPTLGKKGQLIVNGRAVKGKPNSPFKRLYLAAKRGDGRWRKAIFVAWFDHPGRTAEWKAQLDKDTFDRTGSLDFVHEHYPSTDLEALQARTLDKRFPPTWIAALSQERKPLRWAEDTPPLPGLVIFKYPEPGKRYGLGGDPAGGLSDSDESSACVVDADTYEQCAILDGKIEPTQFANYLADLSAYYNNAPLLFELNNHGHAVLAQAKQRGVSLRPGIQRDGSRSKPGWVTTERSKNMLFDTGATVMQAVIEETKDEADDLHLEDARPIIYDFQTASQLAAIDINTLAAPEGEHDDRAMSWVLAMMAVYRGTLSMITQRHNLWGNSGMSRTEYLKTPLDKLALLQRQQNELMAGLPPAPIAKGEELPVIEIDLHRPGLDGVTPAMLMRFKEPPKQ